MLRREGYNLRVRCPIGASLGRIVFRRFEVGRV